MSDLGTQAEWRLGLWWSKLPNSVARRSIWMYVSISYDTASSAHIDCWLNMQQLRPRFFIGAAEEAATQHGPHMFFSPHVHQKFVAFRCSQETQEIFPRQTLSVDVTTSNSATQTDLELAEVRCRMFSFACTSLTPAYQYSSTHINTYIVWSYVDEYVMACLRAKFGGGGSIRFGHSHQTRCRRDRGSWYFAVGVTVMLPPLNFIVSYFYFLFFWGVCFAIVNWKK